ncbi:MAG: hypothetical protein OXB87_02665 [Hyphomicrobiales bacterium]|nr:hypothetical protein [Hyphomicrobiales bacterium]
MSQSVRTKSKPPRTSAPPKDDRFWTGERLGKLETEVVHIKDDMAEIKDNMATKAEIAALRESMDSFKESTKADTAALRESMDSFKESTKADTAHLKESLDSLKESLKDNMATKADLLKTENRILRWMIGVVISIVVLVITVLRFF